MQDRADAASTKKLQALSHDGICDRVESQLERIGDYFLKYHHIVYKVQGPRDQGVDVLLRISNDDSPARYVAFQIKSYAEVDDRGNDLSKLLKAGYHDAREHYTTIDRYYVLLCGDPHLHAKRIQAITAEFAKSAGVIMVHPPFVMNFIGMAETTISSTVDHFLRAEDAVVKQAKGELGGVGQEIGKVLSCLASAWDSREEEADASALMASYSLDQRDMDRFEDKLLVTTAPGRVKVMQHDFPAVRALYYDMQVRYGYDQKTLISHLAKLLVR